MLISVHDLQRQEVKFDQHFPPGSLDLGPEIAQQTPLAARGQADLIEEHEGQKRIADIRLRGDFSTQVEVRCARCLEPVSRDVAGHFDLLYRPAGSSGKPAEAAITEAETEVSFYRGSGVMLEEALAEQVLLAVPLRQLCRAECKGICPHCGQNLNQAQCQCAGAAPDARWLALQEIKSKLKK